MLVIMVYWGLNMMLYDLIYNSDSEVYIFYLNNFGWEKGQKKMIFILFIVIYLSVR